MPSQFNTYVTAHAHTRSSQRGVSAEVREIVLIHADIELPQRMGCRSLQVSARCAAYLLAEGLCADDVEKAQRTTLIVDRDGRVVTAMKMNVGRRVRATHKFARRALAYR